MNINTEVRTKLLEFDGQAARFNEGKPELSYILDFDKALEALARVCSQGAIKYERNNWKKGGKPDEEYLDAALRHMNKFKNGEFYDPDVGTQHIANAAWNLLALIELNYHDEYDLNSNFDQEAYKAKYAR